MADSSVAFPPIGEKVATDLVAGVHTLKVAGTITETPAVPSGTATRAVVGDANADTAILAADATRQEAIIVNNSTAILYLVYGVTAASATVWDERLYEGDRLSTQWQGAMRGFWASDAGGDAHVCTLKA